MANTTDDRQRVPDYMARDYDSMLRAMREQIPYKLPEWNDFESEADFGNVLLQLFAHALDISAFYQDRIANESFLSTARERGSVIRHLQLIGYRLATAAPAAVRLSLHIPAARTDLITLFHGNAFASSSTRERPSVRFEYIGEDRPIDCATLAVDPASGDKLFSFPAEQGRTIAAEVLGQSDGSPNQRFPLGYPGIILRSLGAGSGIRPDTLLEVQLGNLVDTGWIRQQTLAFSRAGQQDYLIEVDDKDRAVLVFGDGAFGAIPPAGAQIRVTYRTGGGTLGNLPAGSIDTIIDAPDLALVGASISNAGAATGGADRETIEHAVAHAPAVFRSMQRAVTRQDYEALARNFPGVGKVRAEPGGWNRVVLFLAPQGGGYLSDLLKADLRAYFEDKRPVNTIVEFEDVDYVDIRVSARVDILGYYSQSEKQSEVEAAAGQLLAFDTLEFGQPLYLSKFYERIEDVEGVASVTITEFTRSARGESHDALTQEPLGKIELAAHELAQAQQGAGYREGIRLLITGGY